MDETVQLVLIKEIDIDWVYFGFSKKSVSSELLSKLQKAYDSAKSEGKFEKVLECYK